MALVFKIKFQGTLRRWVVSEAFNSATFCLTFNELEDKIRDQFHLSDTMSLLLTYVDKDNDVVTLEDDQDLVDACLIQQLNPLRLDVSEKLSVQEGSTESLISSINDANIELVLKSFSNDTTAGENLNAAGTTQFLDAKHSSGVLFKNWKNLESTVQPHTPALRNQRTENVLHIFHHGVQCDRCGMNPIEGPRYKSKKIPNYDLCCSCFDLTGTNTDFEKLNFPETSPQCSHHGLFPFFKRGSKPVLGPISRPLWTSECPFSGQALDYFSSNKYHTKFAARFVEDVTVLDGTELEPGTRFTKTWRMQNNGALPWPQGTQLTHIGGSALSLTEVVILELPEGGLTCGRVVDISVELVAPSNVGRFVSRWRLLLPSGQLFGHMVWVAIQVKRKFEELSMEASHCQEAGKESPQEEVFSSAGMLEGCIDNSVVLPEEEKRSLMLETERENELDGFAVVEKPVESNQAVSVEEILERNLDTQVESIETTEESQSFWLKKNNAGMESTAKELLVEAGWEDKLRNLKEMGFNDQMTNIQMLHKHNGSIKLVVKDLVMIENKANRKDTVQVNFS